MKFSPGMLLAPPNLPKVFFYLYGDRIDDYLLLYYVDGGNSIIFRAMRLRSWDTEMILCE